MARVIVKIAYGYSIIDDNDPFALLADKVGELIHNSGPAGGTLVDFFPWREFISCVHAGYF